MNAPVLVLRPPEKRAGGRLALSADLLLGDDSVEVRALVGPDTQAWVRGRGRALYERMRPRLSRAKKVLSRHVKLAGDWHKAAGELGAFAFLTAADVAQKSAIALEPTGEMRSAAEMYLALGGNYGPGPTDRAKYALDRIAGNCGSDPEAARAKHLLDCCDACADGHVPAALEGIAIARALGDAAKEACCDSCAHGGPCEGCGKSERERHEREKADPCCDGCAHGGACEGESPLVVAYDAARIGLEADLPDQVGYLGHAALGYRALPKIAPRVSVERAAASLHAVVGSGPLWTESGSNSGRADRVRGRG